MIYSKQKLGLKTRIKNFIKALYKHVKSGFKLVTEKEKERRLSICNECTFKNVDNECSICGCYLPMKTAWKTEHCPEKKW